MDPRFNDQDPFTDEPPASVTPGPVDARKRNRQGLASTKRPRSKKTLVPESEEDEEVGSPGVLNTPGSQATPEDQEHYHKFDALLRWEVNTP